MSSTQKRGFRLPWAAEHEPEDPPNLAMIAAKKVDDAPGHVRDVVVADEPLGRAESPAAPTKDAAPAASDVPAASIEAEMSETETATTQTAEVEHAADASPGGGWPSSDSLGAPEPARDAESAVERPAIRVEGEARATRRGNPLVAGLIKAMREAAIASRQETTSQLQAEATARVEAIRSGSTEESAALRKRVDDDIAGIREWSKIEMARIRAETEHRIEERRADAIAESQRHLTEVEGLIMQVQSTVTAFEADMDRFFEELLAENDPARLATLAEHAPEPPDLTGELATRSYADARDDADADAESESDMSTGHADDDAPALEADAAAEAEAEATEGLDMATSDEWPTANVASRHGDAAGTDGEPDGSAHSRLLVSGLTSVAAISAFKGAVGQLAGVRSVSVSSGERGVFVFAVSHDPAVDIAPAVSELVGFAIRINDASADTLTITAHEEAA
jgi:hypothetical protein